MPRSKALASALLDGLLAVESTGLVAEEITVIGGGSRSAYWIRMLADILGKRLVLQQRWR
jgi:xylulokinase